MVVVGAGIAYPLLRIALDPSLPVWMIGAGIFFTSRSSKGKELTRQAADTASDLTDAARRDSRRARFNLAIVASDGKTYVADTASQIADNVSTRRRRCARDGHRSSYGRSEIKKRSATQNGGLLRRILV